jgi:hypothetical protein
VARYNGAGDVEQASSWTCVGRNGERDGEGDGDD